MPVSEPHGDYAARLPVWRKCRDLAAGQEAVHARGEAYLPRLEGQSEEDYGAYKARALFYNATQRTIDGMAGLIFRKAPRAELPAALAELAQDIDMGGVGLTGFAEGLVEELLTVGRVGVLVDHPAGPPGPVTAAQAADANQRPFLRAYRAEDIVDWREGQRQNAAVLTQLRLREGIALAAPGDEFRSLFAEQIRVLDLDAEGFYRQRVFRQLEGQWRQFGPDIQPRLDGRPMTRIPFVFFGPKGNRPAVAKPPLLDLVNVNLSHYRTTADFEHGAHFTGLPTAVITGHRLEEGEGLSIGAGEAWVLPNAGSPGRLSWSSAVRAWRALDAASLDRKEAQMAAIGARMLAPEKRASRRPRRPWPSGVAARIRCWPPWRARRLGGRDPGPGPACATGPGCPAGLGAR